MLNDCKIDDDGLQGLAQFPKLESLHLNGTDISDAGLKTISQLRRFKSLFMDNDKLAGHELGHFNGCQNLEFLSLEVSDWPADSIRKPISPTSSVRHETVLNDIPKLEHIHLTLYPSIESFSLIDLPALKTASIKFKNCPHQATKQTPYKMCDYCKQRTKLVKLGNLPNLSDLSIGFAGQVEVSNANNLTSVTLESAKPFLKNVRQFPNLVWLRICESENVTLGELKQLGPLPKLESLMLNWEEISDETMSVLTNFPNLKRLIIEDGVITEAGIAQISKLEHLEELSFDWVSIKGRGLEPIQNLTQLKTLKLRGSIEELNLSGFAKLENLSVEADAKWLNLENLPLVESIHIADYEDIDVISLRNLASLETFKKRYNEDNSLMSLHLESLPKLRVLDLSHEKPNSDLKTATLANLRDSPVLNELLLENLSIDGSTLDEIDELNWLRYLFALPQQGVEEQFNSLKAKIKRRRDGVDESDDN